MSVEIKEFTISLSLVEVKALHKALGGMSGNDYSDNELACAGSNVYNWLTGIMNIYEEEQGHEAE